MSPSLDAPSQTMMFPNLERRRSLQAILLSAELQESKRRKWSAYASRTIMAVAIVVGVKTYYQVRPLLEISYILYPGSGATPLYGWLGFHRVAQ